MPMPILRPRDVLTYNYDLISEVGGLFREEWRFVIRGRLAMELGGALLNFSYLGRRFRMREVKVVSADPRRDLEVLVVAEPTESPYPGEWFQILLDVPIGNKAMTEDSVSDVLQGLASIAASIGSFDIKAADDADALGKFVSGLKDVDGTIVGTFNDDAWEAFFTPAEPEPEPEPLRRRDRMITLPEDDER